MVIDRVPKAQGKQGEWPKEICQGKHREFGNFVKKQGILSKHRENTANFVSSSCKCSDSKSKGYCDNCRIFFLEAEYVCQASSVYTILTNYVNWHRENLRSDRENTGNLKIQLEWVPWVIFLKYAKIYTCVNIYIHNIMLLNTSQNKMTFYLQVVTKRIQRVVSGEKGRRTATGRTNRTRRCLVPRIRYDNFITYHCNHLISRQPG